MSSRIEVDIAGFGRLVGSEVNGIAEFLNVPFGSIGARFAEASLFTGAPDAVFDCTRQGPLCPQKEPFNDNYNGVPLDKCAPLHVYYDEFKCLNLRLQLPTACFRSHEKIPTVVWLHGGSNIAGTPYRGSSNAQRWLESAVAQGKPFALVTPHYRVGVFGWLPHNGTFNQAIRDQRLAVEWVRRFGRAWNGDIDRISLVGQSAGASDAFVHLCDAASYRLVSQIAMLSGRVGTAGFGLASRYTALVERIEKHVGCPVAEASADQLVRAQSELGINVFVALNPNDPSASDLSRMTVDWDGLKHVRAIVSDCLEDGFFFLEDPRAVEVACQYGVDQSQAGEFYTDLVFRSGANEVWNRGRGTVLRQVCDAINPYSPSWGNNHMVELHYIINGYETRPEFAEAVAKSQQIWTSLVSLETPWDPSSQALHMPSRGVPRVIPIEEARKLRTSRVVSTDSKYIPVSEIILGW